jgi:hypothetical protein
MTDKVTPGHEDKELQICEANFIFVTYDKFFCHVKLTKDDPKVHLIENQWAVEAPEKMNPEMNYLFRLPLWRRREILGK